MADYGHYEDPRHLAIIYQLLNAGSPIDVRYDRLIAGLYGKTALVLAIEDYNFALVKSLIDHGANVNFRDADGSTALMRAIKCSGYEPACMESAKLLIAKGANINVVDKFGRTAMWYAQASPVAKAMLLKVAKKPENRPNLAQAMVDYYKNNQDPRYLAIIYQLLNAGSPINVRYDARYSGDNGPIGETALALAVHDNNFALVKSLIDHGANVNFPDADGGTALMSAIAWAGIDPVCMESAKLLIAKGADVNAKDKFGRTAISFARGNAVVTEMLLKAGATTAQKSLRWNGVWRGKIGDAAVTACIGLDGDNHFGHGAYYYDKYRHLIELHYDNSVVQRRRQMIVTETQGTWTVSLSKDSSIDGTWTSKGHRYPINLKQVLADKGAKDDEDEFSACGDYLFFHGLERPIARRTKTREIDGLQYVLVSDRNHPDVESFELSGAGAGEKKINDRLRRKFDDDIKSLNECNESSLGQFGEMGEFNVSDKPILITGKLLVESESMDESCGGAHPNTSLRYKVWNLETGAKENVWTWFNARGASYNKGVNAWQAGTGLTNILRADWSKMVGNDPDCGDALDASGDFFQVRPDRKGMAFEPEFPFVIQACTQDIDVDYKDLMPLLNEHGKKMVGLLTTQ